MGPGIVCLDTSILIEFFRKTHKEKTVLYRLSSNYDFAVSSITIFEIYSGVKGDSQIKFWNNMLKSVEVIEFNASIAKLASTINSELKKSNRRIDIRDLFIGATAIDMGIPLATLNKKHFQRLPNLTLLDF